MKPLELADQLCLNAAQGWLELGNIVEANEELDRITPKFRAHPLVLRTRWCIYAAARNWEMALEIGRAVRQMNPTDVSGWIEEVEALKELGRTKEGWNTLFAATKFFPKEVFLQYLLACYSSRLGCLSEAKKWLQNAMALDDSAKMKLRALDEPDLEPLWQNIPT
jgi:predicted Zn-dependent protease